jgi:hypothetical protein
MKAKIMDEDGHQFYPNGKGGYDLYVRVSLSEEEVEDFRGNPKGFVALIMAQFAKALYGVE